MVTQGTSKQMTDKEMWRLANGICSVLQIEEEILWAMESIKRYMGNPLKNFLEIGSHGGGSLCMWSQIMADEGTLYGITLHDAPMQLQNTVSIITGKRVSIINAPSELDSTKDRLVELLDGERLDGIFVDSLHTAEQSKRELDLYLPLLNSPGVFAYHDIKPVHGEGSTGHFFQPIKFDYSYEEKRTGKHSDMGIGLLLL